MRTAASIGRSAATTSARPGPIMKRRRTLATAISSRQPRVRRRQLRAAARNAIPRWRTAWCSPAGTRASGRGSLFLSAPRRQARVRYFPRWTSSGAPRLALTGFKRVVSSCSRADRRRRASHWASGKPACPRAPRAASDAHEASGRDDAQSIRAVGYLVDRAKRQEPSMTSCAGNDRRAHSSCSDERLRLGHQA